MSYSNLLRHHSMVLDEVRNRAYLEAMRRVITPESVVLDLGAGLGVLGLLAAKLGARKVYCVEPSPVAAHIPALAKANGVADRVVALRGRIEEVELPEQVDVILSVFTGNLLFTEGLMPSLYFARDNHLKPGGAMIPDRARLWLAAAECGFGYGETVGRYRKSSLGIDYACVADAVANGMFLMERGENAPQLLTSALLATEIDLYRTRDDAIKWRGQAAVVRDGTAHGLLGWIELHLGGTWLSAAPDGDEVHWSPALLPLATPLQLHQGQALELAFQFVDDARMFWSLSTGDTINRQSTVQGNRDAAIDVMLSSPDCSNLLGTEGLLVERVLAGMRAGRSNQEIARDMSGAFPDRFGDDRDALRRVGALAARYRSHPARSR